VPGGSGISLPLEPTGTVQPFRYGAGHRAPVRYRPPMGVTRLLAVGCVVCVVAAAGGYAQVASRPLGGGGEITVDAQEVSDEQKTDTVVARGNVVIRRGDTELRADEVRMNRHTNDAEAQGHVTITDTEGRIQADHVEFNLDDETGALQTAHVYSRRNHYTLW